jgi:hypothetical protein
MHLTTGKALVVYGKAELLGDAVDVVDVEMNEGVRSRVTLVLREVEVDVSSCDGNEPRKAGLELMLPFLFEPEPLVPGDSARRVLGVENRNNLLVHAAEITARVGKERIACASVRERSRMRPSRVSEEAARAASSALAMVDTAERLLNRDLEASDYAGVSASRE